MRVRNTWAGMWVFAIFWTVILIMFIAVLACGKKKGGTPETSVCQPVTICDDTKLASHDLTGACRATPQATMGAIEALSC